MNYPLIPSYFFWDTFHYVVLTVTTAMYKGVTTSPEHSRTMYASEHVRLQPKLVGLEVLACIVANILSHGSTDENIVCNYFQTETWEAV